MYLDTRYDHFWRLQRVSQYTHEDHIPDRIKLRASQNDCQSNHENYELNQRPKYFEIRPSQPRNIENFGRGSVGYLKVTKDKSSEGRVQTSDVGLISTLRQHQDARVETRVSASLQHQGAAASRRKGRNPRSLQYQDTRVETRVSVSLQHQDVRVKTRISVLLQHQGARAETRVSVITALVIGSITAHIMRKLTPIMERF